MKTNRILPWFIVVGALSLTACSSNPKSEKDGGSTGAGSAETYQTEGEQGVEVIGAGQQGIDGEVVGIDINDGEALQGEASELGKTIEPRIFFGFDQYNVDEEGLAIVKHYANILVDNPEETIKLIGHTDERGTPEYNLALGEKRAKAVEEAFMLYGVSSRRMEVITMGEEQPYIDGHYEEAWAKNRRVEIVIK